LLSTFTFSCDCGERLSFVLYPKYFVTCPKCGRSYLATNSNLGLGRVAVHVEDYRPVIPSVDGKTGKPRRRVFLGGTCNESTWRERLIPTLTIDYFNPVVPDWTPECQAREVLERETCDFVLYTITPKMSGVYSIAEVVDDSNKRPYRTILCLLLEDEGMEFDPKMRKSLLAVAKLVGANGASVVMSLKDAAEILNGEVVGVGQVK
jgi:hypothetical protein